MLMGSAFTALRAEKVMVGRPSRGRGKIEKVERRPAGQARIKRHTTVIEVEKAMPTYICGNLWSV
ncbi:MAG TPA: hypothetical protein DEB31_07450 [Clostridiales bacterium]|nr:hypothetical protein [Clostridiales bacterium]